MADAKEEEKYHALTTNMAVPVNIHDDDEDDVEHKENTKAININLLKATEDMIMNSSPFGADTTPSQFDDDENNNNNDNDYNVLSRADIMQNIEPFQIAPDTMEYNTKKVKKYEKRPCLRLFSNIFGWMLWFIWWFILVPIICILFGPIIFITIKSRYIWNNTVWESLIYTLNDEDSLYLLKDFPFPSFFKHCGASYTASNILIIILKIIYVIPQGIILGPYIFGWLLTANYVSIKQQNSHYPQFDIMLKYGQWIRRSPVGHTTRRTLSSAFFILDVSTDVIIMVKLYNGKEKYWFSLTFGSILVSYFVPWARSITYVKEYIVKSQDKRCHKRIIRSIAALFLIPWFGIFVIIFLDIYLIINILLDWLRLLILGRSRIETEEEISYRRLRTLTELMCESIPQLIIQYYILRTYQDSNDQEKIDNLGLDEFDLYRSMLASGMNLIFQLISLYLESAQLRNKGDGLEDMTFFQYMFISMEGRFGFNTKLLSIQSGAQCVDLTKIEFRSDQYLLANFFQATSKNRNRKNNQCQRIIISPQTVAGLENEENPDILLKLNKHCIRNKIELLINCSWDSWYLRQFSCNYCLDVQHIKEEPHHTSLTYAISKDGYDGFDYLDRLLKSGIDVNKPNGGTDSPLLLSCMLKKEDYTKKLLEGGARINELNSQNKTALFHACARRELDLIKILLDYNVNVFIQDNEFGNTVLNETAWNWDKMVQLILQHPNVQKQQEIKQEKLVNISNNKGETPLFKAANFGMLEIVEMLIENGANINHQDANGNTVLFKTKKVDIVEFLIENGADVNIENNRKETPLFAALFALTLMPIYYKKCNNINHKDMDGNTIFHHLAKKHEWKYMYSLIHIHKMNNIKITTKNNKDLSIYDLIIHDEKNGNNAAIQHSQFFLKKQKEELSDTINI